jgi:hypothetical protein
MAIITPFADPNAHGSIAKTFSFRRSMHGVIFEKKPYPSQPDSVDQLAQRQLFLDAIASWKTLSGMTREFYNTRGKDFNLSGYNLYLKHFLSNTLPSTTPLWIHWLYCTSIINIRAAGSTDVTFTFKIVGGSTEYSYIRDTENVATITGSADPVVPVRLFVNNASGKETHYLFRDGLYVTWADISENLFNIVIRFPDFITSEAGRDFYVADDGSLYEDAAMTNLISTDVV